MSQIHWLSDQVDKLRRQRGALAEFGKKALRSNNLDDLLQHASTLVSDAMGIELVKVLELLPDRQAMLVRAGVNWNPGVVGNSTLGADGASPGGYALKTDDAVISPDLAAEDRFEIPDLLKEHGVASMVNVVIRGEGEAWGVLEVDARERRDFDQDDIGFLQNYANLLASAVERLKTHAELKDAEERQRVLMHELQHRVQNLLANVRALASRTRQGSGDVEEFAANFDARLVALARTQILLSDAEAGGADLRSAVCQELEAHGAREGQQFSLQGPEVRLRPDAAQTLGLAFHELATNAVKHGALGKAAGTVEISWQVTPLDDGKEVAIRWRELGIQIDTNPSRRGFGSDIIERRVPQMLGGHSRTVFHPDGIECELSFRIRDSR